MLNFIKQNKKILVITLGLFLTSSAILFLTLSMEHDVGNKNKASISHSSEIVKVRSEEEYRAILHDKKNPILALDIDGKIQFASDEFLQKLQITDSVQEVSYYDFFHKDDLVTFMNAYGELLKNKTPVSAVGPYRLRTGNGNYVYHIGYLAPLLNKDGEIESILVVTKSIEDKMQEINEAYERMLKSDVRYRFVIDMASLK